MFGELLIASGLGFFVAAHSINIAGKKRQAAHIYCLLAVPLLFAFYFFDPLDLSGTIAAWRSGEFIRSLWVVLHGVIVTLVAAASAAISFGYLYFLSERFDKANPVIAGKAWPWA